MGTEDGDGRNAEQPQTTEGKDVKGKGAFTVPYDVKPIQSPADAQPGPSDQAPGGTGDGGEGSGGSESGGSDSGGSESGGSNGTAD